MSDLRSQRQKLQEKRADDHRAEDTVTLLGEITSNCSKGSIPYRWLRFNLEGKMERVECRFLTRISTIEENFTDKMGLIDQISGSPNW
jgi:hypothetical protein